MVTNGDYPLVLLTIGLVISILVILAFSLGSCLALQVECMGMK